ncbi:SWIM zinc finger family protein [Brachybacterium sp.]|uniref:SWIM zinc finger family protein n=1 Tax=Brachybacterium sp. TaxID=1891286 RepID=UPI002ED6A883
MNIELVSRRGAVGKSWHAVALRDGAERLLGPARVGRGKADARAGRVQWLDVDAGAARGDVLDADGELYHARLELPALRPDDRQVFVQVARTHPELPARLASGEYPQQIEAELAASEVSLLPRNAAELTHDCSCLDWPGPCRHVSALLYVLVEAVDERPLLLLTLRGISLEDLAAPAAPAERGPRDPDVGEHGVRGPGGGAGAPGGGDAAVGAGAGEQEHRSDDADQDGEQSAAPPAAFDPARTDPSRLIEVVGEEAAAVIHRFYTGHS